MHSIRPTTFAVLAAMALAGCGSTGIAVKGWRSTDVEIPTSRAADGRKVVPASPILSPAVANGFDFLYYFVTETEFVLCLEGDVTEGRLRIDAFRLAQIETTTPTYVRYQACPAERYVGTAHNHPPGDRSDLCARSGVDDHTFANDTVAVVDIVICGRSKYAWVLKNGRSGIVVTAPPANVTANFHAARR